ncbi:MAG: FAD-dependent oxidoreductase [Pseudomonadales bacterium]|nr:FAD-dependent oxidoreductase [Pseudomonadales bacterium]NRA14379.1 FAD-dependent oxidoreductase [Oceanospirillaceae bacterium]
MKKIIIIAFVIALAMIFYQMGLDQYLSLQGVKNSQAQFAQLYTEQPIFVALVYMALYIFITALSIPGAAVLTLAGGALFGLFWGTIIVSFASSIGATLAFLVARLLLKDSAQQRFGDKLKAINQGVEREGGFYLFTLRLVPLFPFFMINLMMGLTPIRAVTFYWVSQVGMFAGTIVYVNAGTQLGQIDSLSGILSPALLFSFILLGIFPLLAKKISGHLQAKKVYAQWQKPKSFDRNIVVLGAGAAGLVSSYIGAAVKAKVTLVEAHKMGGDCLNYGCVPSKALIKSAKVAQLMRSSQDYGLHYDAYTQRPANFSFKQVMQRVQHMIRQVEPHDSVERYSNLGVDVVQGYGKIIDPWTVEIKKNDGQTQRLTTRSIIIAAGAKPVVPDIPGLAECGYLTSDTMWEALAEYDSTPERIIFLGGGPIGCELSQSFARLGSKVWQIEKHQRLMRREDPEVSELARTALEKSGVQVLTEHQTLRCENRPEGKFLILEHRGEQLSLEFDVLICAVGRTARLSGYGLEELGIDTKGTVITNDYLQTIYPNIYAAGDVAGPFQFTHTAAHQAWYAAVNSLFGEFKKFKVDYSVIPWTTFIDPEVARVGLNEQQAKEQNKAYEVTLFDIGELDRAIVDGNTTGFVKVLTVPGKDKILGVTIVAANAGELLAEYVLAMKHNLGLNKILGTIHTYPTMSEANKYAAGVWKKAHAPQRVLAWLEKFHRRKLG